MDKNIIIQGNCLETLKTLPDNSINCCVTSPPYYGLRDYGTGTWVGGDPDCPHRRLSKQSDKTITGHKQEELKGNVGDAIYKSVCPICGAVRVDEQVGLEDTPEQYIDKMVAIFHEVKRLLKDDGTLWVNIGDSYVSSGSRGCDYDDFNHSQRWMQTASQGTMHNSNIPKFNTQGIYKNKDMIGIPWMLAFALRNDGWYLRQDIIWHKPNPMPESVKDRFTKSHEYVFLLSKSPQYYFDHEAVQETANPSSEARYKSAFNVGSKEVAGGGRPGSICNTAGMKEYTGKRNKRDVWSVSPNSWSGAHFATFPEELIRPMILAGCPKDGVVLDPFMGSGTVGVVAKKNHRNYIGCELNPEYVEMANNRIHSTTRKLI